MRLMTENDMVKEENMVVGPQTKVRVSVIVIIATVAVSLIGSLTVLAWNASAYAARLTTDMSWVKTSLATIVTRFDQVDSLKAHVDQIDSFGSQAARHNADVMKELDARVSKLEEYGSPRLRTLLEQLQKEVVEIRNKQEMHEATTRPAATKP